jgi:hypothetical protein
MYCEHCFTVSPTSSTHCIQCRKAFIEETPNNRAKKIKKEEGDGVGKYAGVAGLAIGLYTGIFILFMMVGYFTTSWLGKKFLNGKAVEYIETIAIQASLILVPAAFMTYIVANGLMPLTYVFVLFDVALPIVGLMWLIKRPSLNPLIVLTIFQLIVLAVNFINIFEMNIGTQDHKALSNYIVWRIGAIYFMWSVYFNNKNNDVRNIETTS